MPPRCRRACRKAARTSSGWRSCRRGDKSQLVLERTIPDPAATQNPEFTAAEHSVLADGIAELRVSYFGRDANANDVDLPSWRDRWDDRQRLPLLMRIDVKPVQRPGMADARRRAAARARIRVRVVRPVAQPLRGGGLMRALRPSPAARQQGIALIAVLWLTILLTVIASGFAYSMHGEAVAARNALSLAQARAAADGAVERTAFELTRPRNLPDVWQADGSARTWSDGEIKVTTWALDEASRIDLNTASDPLLKGLLQNVGGARFLCRRQRTGRDPRLARRRRSETSQWRRGA